MSGWPTDILQDHPDKAMFTYFKRGTIIVHDSNVSNRLYIIKSVRFDCLSLSSLAPSPTTCQKARLPG